tara:strand:- start:124 stop:648 length:525 start_codon:yes stop_codon:yes gene_type:complete
MIIKNLEFIDFLTVTFIVEVISIIIVRNNDVYKWLVKNWWTNLQWTAVILDMASLLGGFYLAKFAYLALLNNNIISNAHAIFKYSGILIIIQVIHDIMFYFTTILPTKRGSNYVIDLFKDYAKIAKTDAITGDSLMYLITLPILFNLNYLDNDSKIFICILCLYLLGYLIYKKK